MGEEIRVESRGVEAGSTLVERWEWRGLGATITSELVVSLIQGALGLSSAE